MATETNGAAMAVRQPHRDNTSVQLQSKSLDTMTVAGMLAKSGFFGEVKEQGQALAKILAGQELGMGPIASLMGVYFSNGKITYSANIMAASIKRSGVYTFRIKRHDNDGCTLAFFERGEQVGESSFTMEDAKTAGLTTGNGRGNWEKYPRNMCFARAMSNGAKWFCPDVFGGITPYTPDELGAEVRMTDDGEMVPIKVEVIDRQPERSPRRVKMETKLRSGIQMAESLGIELEPLDVQALTDEDLQGWIEWLAVSIKSVQEQPKTETVDAEAAPV